MTGEFVKKQRAKRDMTQEYLASELGISRPTYMQIERGARELTVSEAKKLADIFDMPLGDFLAEKEESEPVVVIREGKSNRPAKSGDVRISVPQQNLKKFKEVLLYVLEKVGARPNIGETAIYKLLYFIDFDYYEKFEEQLIGAKYIKNHFGPTPVEFKKITDQMIAKGELDKIKSKYFQHEQKKYLPRRPADLKVLSARELAHIDWEIGRFGDMTAAQISALSHIDTPWRVAKDRKPLEYEHVFYRPEETSVRQYEPL